MNDFCDYINILTVLALPAPPHPRSSAGSPRPLGGARSSPLPAGGEGGGGAHGSALLRAALYRTVPHRSAPALLCTVLYRTAPYRSSSRGAPTAPLRPLRAASHRPAPHRPRGAAPAPPRPCPFPLPPLRFLSPRSIPAISSKQRDAPQRKEKYGSDDVKKLLRFGGHHGSSVAAAAVGGGRGGGDTTRLRTCGKSARANCTAGA